MPARSVPAAAVVASPVAAALSGFDAAQTMFIDRLAAARELAAVASRLAAVAAALVVEPHESSRVARRLLDARKVATMLDTTPHAVYELHRTGKLAGVRVGKRRLRFREEDVISFGSSN
jgi:hypothetical protein